MSGPCVSPPPSPPSPPPPPSLPYSAIVFPATPTPPTPPAPPAVPVVEQRPFFGQFSFIMAIAVGSMVALLFLVLCCCLGHRPLGVVAISFITRRRGGNRPRAPAPAEHASATAVKDFEFLPTRTIGPPSGAADDMQVEEVEDAEECPICLSELAPGDIAMQLPCGHGS